MALAVGQVAELENMARTALSDVRATVSGYRTLSLDSELAGARMVLRAAGVRAELPAATESVCAELREAFTGLPRRRVPGRRPRAVPGDPPRTFARSRTDMIRVPLTDDQALVLGALAAVLRLEPDIDVVAEIGTGTEALPAAQRTVPDIALLDVQMPGRDPDRRCRPPASAARLPHHQLHDL
ncbi:hypothetical protein T261_0539 [Streptomyces lydicus]|nr:hypothetical protein T261_0539 [Streptomyces lydicus]